MSRNQTINPLLFSASNTSGYDGFEPPAVLIPPLRNGDRGMGGPDGVQEQIHPAAAQLDASAEEKSPGDGHSGVDPRMASRFTIPSEATTANVFSSAPRPVTPSTHPAPSAAPSPRPYPSATLTTSPHCVPSPGRLMSKGLLTGSVPPDHVLPYAPPQLVNLPPFNTPSGGPPFSATPSVGPPFSATLPVGPPFSATLPAHHSLPHHLLAHLPLPHLSALPLCHTCRPCTVYHTRGPTTVYHLGPHHPGYHLSAHRHTQCGPTTYLWAYHPPTCRPTLNHLSAHHPLLHLSTPPSTTPVGPPPSTTPVGPPPSTTLVGPPPSTTTLDRPTTLYHTCRPTTLPHLSAHHPLSHLSGPPPSTTPVGPPPSTPVGPPPSHHLSAITLPPPTLPTTMTHINPLSTAGLLAPSEANIMGQVPLGLPLPDPRPSSVEFSPVDLGGADKRGASSLRRPKTKYVVQSTPYGPTQMFPSSPLPSPPQRTAAGLSQFPSSPLPTHIPRISPPYSSGSGNLIPHTTEQIPMTSVSSPVPGLPFGATPLDAGLSNVSLQAEKSSAAFLTPTPTPPGMLVSSKRVVTGHWHRQIDIKGGDRIMIHSSRAMIHYVSVGEEGEYSTGVSVNGSQTPLTVKRGTEDFEIEDGEAEKVDHLLFLVHGIGSVCDLRFRAVEECVDDFRKLGQQLLSSHFKQSVDMGLVGRVEILPISWHKHIMDTVVSELNRLHALFCTRNPSFNGLVSLGGHSLGSVILFDLLMHQSQEHEDSVDSSLSSPKDDHDNCLRGRVNSITSPVNYVMGAAGTGQPSSTWNRLYELYSGSSTSPSLEAQVDEALADQLYLEDEEAHSASGGELRIPVGRLNEGRRIDYVLQEKPYESFNEYIFALQAHVTYWESEDTMLLILKELYGPQEIFTDTQINHHQSPAVSQAVFDGDSALGSGSASPSSPGARPVGSGAAAPDPGDPVPLLAPTSPGATSPTLTMPFNAMPPATSHEGPRIISGRPVVDVNSRQSLGMDPTVRPINKPHVGPPPKLPGGSFVRSTPFRR
ncbi:SEC23-interacting protein-like [Homarus americanus]|uniref:SEC23-interacting protein-like n=1 Tax=Homarus americanus TaxID=6706 RepID=A0A8J5J8Q6_HOMAM|nr:SEC23-interacting protein-like [Homarus americanus]